MLGTTATGTAVSDLTRALPNTFVILKSLNNKLAEFPDDRAGCAPRLCFLAQFCGVLKLI